MDNPIKETYNQIFSALIIQAILFILLAFGVIVFPKLLNFLVGIVFLASGFSLIAAGMKVRKLYKKVEEFWKKLGV